MVISMTKKQDNSKKEEKDHDKKQEELESLKDTVQRVQAEFENYKKRVDKMAHEQVMYASKEVITELLPIIDNLELALKNTSEHSEFVKGIEMIHSQLISLLDKFHVKKVICEGHKFDPFLHEALMQEECDPEKHGCIIEEFQPGYKIGDRVLRHAKVKVGNQAKNGKKEQDHKDNKKDD